MTVLGGYGGYRCGVGDGMSGTRLHTDDDLSLRWLLSSPLCFQRNAVVLPPRVAFPHLVVCYFVAPSGPLGFVNGHSLGMVQSCIYQEHQAKPEIPGA